MRTGTDPPYRIASLATIFFLAVVTLSSVAQADSRVELIRQKGYLSCGVLPHVAGFATVDEEGRYSGFEIDFCRALSAAILGDPDEVRYVVVRTVDQFINRNDIDIVSRRLTWTLRREAENSLLFSPVIFYDGVGFLVRASSNLQYVRELAEQPVCVRSGSEANRALNSYFAAAQLKAVDVPKDSLAVASKAFFSNECAALVADVSELAAERAAQGAGSENFKILREMISKEPLSLLMRQGDEEFFLIVRWTIFLLIAAEEFDLSSTNIDARIRSDDPRIRHIAGSQTNIGSALGLDAQWAVNVISGVGNYGEIFSRNLGRESPIKLERGLNNLWTSGGLMYAPPLR